MFAGSLLVRQRTRKVAAAAVEGQLTSLPPVLQSEIAPYALNDVDWQVRQPEAVGGRGGRLCRQRQCSGLPIGGCQNKICRLLHPIALACAPPALAGSMLTYSKGADRLWQEEHPAKSFQALSDTERPVQGWGACASHAAARLRPTQLNGTVGWICSPFQPHGDKCAALRLGKAHAQAAVLPAACSRPPAPPSAGHTHEVCLGLALMGLLGLPARIGCFAAGCWAANAARG